MTTIILLRNGVTGTGSVLDDQLAQWKLSDPQVSLCGNSWRFKFCSR